jgi:hypothetical protein
MLAEIHHSGHLMRTLCTLPLLDVKQTVNILTRLVLSYFKNEEHIEISCDVCIAQLADVCGGHPTSIQYITAICNSNTTIADEVDHLKSLIDRCQTPAYRHVDQSLLGERVNKTDRVGNETFEDLVNRGVLILLFGFMSTNRPLFQCALSFSCTHGSLYRMTSLPISCIYLGATTSAGSTREVQKYALV